jgi:plasmid stabilization system protein ParE
MAFEVVFLRCALADVEKIYEFISCRSSSGANRWYAALSDAVASLTHDPNRCAVAPESVRLKVDLRQRLFKTARGRSYRLLFVVAGGQVRVLRIRGPGQPPLKRRDI